MKDTSGVTESRSIHTSMRRLAVAVALLVLVLPSQATAARIRPFPKPPPQLAPFPTDPAQELAWSDIIETKELKGGTSGTQRVVFIDMSKLHRTRIDEEDPYWFKYYRSFWDDKGRFVNRGTLGELSRRRTDCFGLEWYPAATQPIHTSNGTRFNTRQCVQSWQKNANRVCDRWLVSHYRGAIGAFSPGLSSLGYNYYDRRPVSLNFLINLNEYIPLRDSDSRCTSAGVWRTVHPGEVTPKGWGIVPQSDTPSGTLPTPFLSWLFIVPKGEDISITPCLPGVLGCNEPLIDGGRKTIYDPPLWTASDEEKLRRLLEQGQALGDIRFGNRVTLDDMRKEGFYIQSKNPDGTWATSRKMTESEVWATVQQCNCLTVNGSGANFAGGILSGSRMAAAKGRSINVHYYMPQTLSLNAFARAKNQQMVFNLNTLAGRANQTRTNVAIQTHSWSSWVTWNSVNSNPYLHHISYGFAALPRDWSRARSRVAAWRGTGEIIGSQADPIAIGTLTQAEIGAAQNSNVLMRWVQAGHGLTSYLENRPPDPPREPNK